LNDCRKFTGGGVVTATKMILSDPLGDIITIAIINIHVHPYSTLFIVVVVVNIVV
jgi:hypothetical protein